MAAFVVYSPLLLAWPSDADSAWKRCGAYQITGTVKELGVAGAYKVRLFDRDSHVCLRGTWSDASGNYEFKYLANVQYYVVAFDHGDNPVNAAISDYVTPAPM